MSQKKRNFAVAIYSMLPMGIIKRIDLYVMKNFLVLFAATFFICSFILILQTLWLIVDDLIGKGLPWGVLFELFFYIWLTLVPMALPLAILLASLMSFGDMGEKLELLAMKSAGISLFRIMRSLMVFIVCVCVGAFVFSNNVIPFAKKKMNTIMTSIRNTSPELSIPTGEFYSGIRNMRLYVRDKNHDTGALLDVMIYDFSQGFDRSCVITADTVFVRMTEDKRNLKLVLLRGEMFENMKKDSRTQTDNVPYRRETFVRREMLLDYDGGFQEMDGAFLNSHHASKDFARLAHDIDSVRVERDSIVGAFAVKMKNETYFEGVYAKADTLDKPRENVCYDADSLFMAATYSRMRTIVGRMRSDISSVINDYQYQRMIISDAKRFFVRHSIELHRKFTLSFACLIFFFIGAPLGAIIRKGGLGMPAVVSVLLFIVYYIVDTFGLKMAKEEIWPVEMGMWLSSMILLPIGVFLTYKAATDSQLFNSEAYAKRLNRAKRWLMRCLAPVTSIFGKKKTTEI